MSRLLPVLGVCAALTLAGGCALNTIRPPTPATNSNADRKETSLPGEHYYVLIWAWQRVPRQPTTSHTFVTVVHTVESIPGQATVVEARTISWLPATLIIRPTAFVPEPGVNLTLKESLDYAGQNGERVSLWGPFECRPNFYKRFLMQKEFLETSGIGYQCTDNIGRVTNTGEACNCIHAITDMDPEFGRSNYPLIWFGDAASEHIAYRMRNRGSILNPEVEHYEILTTLGLNDYPIRRRRFDDSLFIFPRLQPALLLRELPLDPGQAPPYPAPPYPPPGRRDP